MRVFDLLKTRIEKMEEKRDVKGLILALKDDDEQLRLESARALGKIGSPEAIEPLTQTLHDPDKGVKEEAITALGKIGDTKATPPLVDALNSQYISIRWRAAQALGKIGSPEAIEPLTQTLHDPDKGVKEEAITALGKIGDTKATPPLVDALNSQYISIRWRAAQALGKIGSPEAIEPLTQSLNDPDKEVREEAITALGRINIQPLLKDLESSDSAVKSDAVTAVNRPPKKTQINNNRSKVRISTGTEEKIIRPPIKEKVKETGINESDKENELPVTDKVTEKKPSFKETVRLISQGKAREKQMFELSKEEKSEIKPSKEEKSKIKVSEEEIPETKPSSKEKIETIISKELPGTKISKEERPEELKTVKISKKDKKLKEISRKEEKRELTSSDTLKTPHTIEEENIDETEQLSSEPKIPEETPEKQMNKPDIKDKSGTNPVGVFKTEPMVGPVASEVLINPVFEKEENIILSSENADFKDREKKLYDKGLYHLIRRFVRKSKYEYLDNFVRKSRYDYQYDDLQKLKDLLIYKGIEFTDDEIRWMVQEEVKKQEYQEFEDKIIKTESQPLQKYLENYIKNYPQDTPENIQNLEKLLIKEKIPTENLEEQIEKTRRHKEILEFQNKLLQPSLGTTEDKHSPSILIKFMKKDLLEKREKLISTGQYKYFENFVRMAKYDYHMGDLQKFRNMLEYKGINFQDEEIIWLIQGEIEKQDYQEFEDRIMETQPNQPQKYLENYIKNYPQDTPENIQNLEKLLIKEKIPTENLEEQIRKVRKLKEIEEFEMKLYKKLEPDYNSIPVIESNVSKDKALKNAQILYNLGNLFYDLGKTDDALLYYDKALCIYPDYIDAWKNKGLIFYTMGRAQKATACYNHVLKIDPDYGEVWLDIGVILFEMGKLKEAKICYENALDMDPSYNKETSLYSRQFLHKNPYYQEIFDNYLDSVSTIELLEESSDSLSPISQIMQLLMNLNH